VPFIIKAVWFVGVVFFISLILLILGHNYLRFYLFGKGDKDQDLFIKYETLLIEFLSMDSANDKYTNEQIEIVDFVKKSVKRKHTRRVVISCLIKLTHEVSGELEFSIYRLYKETGLEIFALNKLNANDDFRLVNGIRQLNLFHADSAIEKVKIHLNHEKDVVRNEVQLYLVKILKFKGLFFLDSLEKPLSEWSQIQILEILKRFEDQEIHDVSKWLKSDNEDVVLFALKLVEIYNLFDMNDLMIELLDHSSVQVRLNCIRLICYLHSKDGKLKLKEKFNLLSIDEKIFFFKELHHTVDKDDVDFIKKHVVNTKFEIKLSAMQLLYDLDFNFLESLKLDVEDEDSEKILNYLLN
jgi:hypothetical protein